jgi:hypothetical protein
MRTTDLTKIAAQAEILRFQRLARRQGLRTAYGVVAGLFALLVLMLLNAIAWQVLDRYFQQIYATIILLGTNFVIMVGFTIPAVRSKPGRDERDALEVRNRAVEELQKSLAITAILPVAVTLLRAARGKRTQGGLLRRIRHG